MSEKPLNVYVGLDRSFGKVAAAVCMRSILNHASIPVDFTLLDLGWLRRVGLYTRPGYTVNGQFYDGFDGRPASTEFSFSRFLTPSLQPHGHAVFVDGDFMFRTDIAELASHFVDDAAVQCVHHMYAPTETTKMHGQVQSRYPRKNWSSLMVFNCDHRANEVLTPALVNTMDGRWLHAMGWLTDLHIGSVPHEWNWLDGSASERVEPKAVHFTRGTPDMPGWADTQYANEWREIQETLSRDDLNI